MIALFIKKRIDPPADYRKSIADKSAEKFCPTSTKMLVTKYPDAAASALGAISYQINNKNYEANSDFFAKDMKTADQTIAILKSANDDQCKKQNLESCGALTTFAKVEEKYDAEKKRYTDNLADNAKRAKESDEDYRKDLAYEKSPQKIVDQACNTVRLVQMAKENIHREQDVGDKSGVVNMVTLHDWGQRLQASETYLKELKVDVRKRTGREFSQSMCKKTQTAGNE